MAQKTYDPRRQKMRKAKPAKSVALTAQQEKQVKSLIKGNIETKSAYKTYATSTFNNQDDMLVLSSDVYGGIGQGALDDSTPGSNNRIGDSVQSQGILFNFELTARNVFGVVGVGSFTLPWVNVRLMIFTAKNSVNLTGLPTKAKCLDLVAMNTLQGVRIPWSMDNFGYVKDVLYDKIIKIRNDGLFVNNGIANEAVLGNSFHFKKYLNYKKNIKYTDNVSGSTNQTNEPIFFAILAETAPYLSTGIAVGAPLVTASGYTKVFYKDA